MNRSRLLATRLLGLLCIVLTGCGPKVDMTPVAGIWANADQSRIIILDADRGLWHLVLSPGPGSGATYATTAGKYKAKAADLFEASIKSLDLSIKATATAGAVSNLAITETIDGKTQTSEFKRVIAPTNPELKALGLQDSGNGKLSVRTQETLHFSYANKTQDGLSYYSLTSKDRPELMLHLFAGRDGLICALVRNSKDGHSYLLALAARAETSGNVALETHSPPNTASVLRFSVSLDQGSVWIREI